jgi:hypothetical protein
MVTTQPPDPSGLPSPKGPVDARLIDAARQLAVTGARKDPRGLWIGVIAVSFAIATTVVVKTLAPIPDVQSLLREVNQIVERRSLVLEKKIDRLETRVDRFLELHSTSGN